VDVDHVVYETHSARVGAFRCPASHRSFRDSGPTAITASYFHARPSSSSTRTAGRSRPIRRWLRVQPRSGIRASASAPMATAATGSVSDVLLRDALAGRDP
jgi:hypothetical protein